MFLSEHFGRAFWIDDNNDLKSCPLKVNNEPDLKYWDYVSEWDDWEGVNKNILFDIHKACIFNKKDYNGSLTINGV